MTFGQSAANFLVDSPAAVAQRALTRLKLNEGEWYIDLLEGLPLFQDILAQKNIGLAAAVIRDRISGTPFLNAILSYSVNFNEITRAFQVLATANTAFGPVTVDYPIRPTVGSDYMLGSSPLGPIAQV